MLSDLTYPTPFPIFPPAMRTRARARMLGGGHPLGSSAMLDARQDANSPRASWLDACFAWRAKPSLPMRRAERLLLGKFTCRRLRWRLTNEEIHCADGLLTQPSACPAGSAGRFMFSSLVKRQLSLSLTTAAGHSLDRVGAVGSFAGARAPSSLLGCTPEQGAILAALPGCQDGNGRCCLWRQPPPCSPGGSHPAATRVGALRSKPLLDAAVLLASSALEVVARCISTQLDTTNT